MAAAGHVTSHVVTMALAQCKDSEGWKFHSEERLGDQGKEIPWGRQQQQGRTVPPSGGNVK